MARVGTPVFDLGMWLLNENPGAGTQDPSAIGKALNDNWKKIEKAMAIVLKPDGTLNTLVIDGPNLKGTVVDAVTLQLTGSPAKLSVKNAGIDTAQIKDHAVTSDKMATGSVDTPQLFDNAVTETKLGNLVVSSRVIADAAVTDRKIPHDKATRKHFLHMVILTGTTVAKISETAPDLASGQGVPMPLAGFITAYHVSDASGNQALVRQAYASSGATSTGKFTAGDRITAFRNTSTGVTYPRINTTNVTALGPSVGGGETDTLYVTIEYELDDIT